MDKLQRAAKISESILQTKEHPMTSLQFASRSAITLLGCAILAVVAAAQFPSAPKPLEPKMPQGVGGCTINKPCAAVAPDIIKKALGPSPVESNLRQLTDVVGGRVTRLSRCR